MIDATDLTIVSKKLSDKQGFLDAMHPGVEQAADELAAHARAEAPRSSGLLARNTDATVGKDLSVTLATSPSVPYAGFVYGGTRAHTIRTDKVLSFSMGTHQVFARHVHIPAQPANPYLQRTFNLHAAEFNEAIEETADTVIQKDLQV